MKSESSGVPLDDAIIYRIPGFQGTQAQMFVIPGYFYLVFGYGRGAASGDAVIDAQGNLIAKDISPQNFDLTKFKDFFIYTNASGDTNGFQNNDKEPIKEINLKTGHIKTIKEQDIPVDSQWICKDFYPINGENQTTEMTNLNMNPEEITKIAGVKPNAKDTPEGQIISQMKAMKHGQYTILYRENERIVSGGDYKYIFTDYIAYFDTKNMKKLWDNNVIHEDWQFRRCYWSDLVITEGIDCSSLIFQNIRNGELLYSIQRARLCTIIDNKCYIVKDDFGSSSFIAIDLNKIAIKAK